MPGLRDKASLPSSGGARHGGETSQGAPGLARGPGCPLPLQVIGLGMQLLDPAAPSEADVGLRMCIPEV